MNTLKSLTIATALASSFITSGFASQVVEDTGTMKRVIVHMGQENTAPIELEAGWSGPEITHRWTVENYPSLGIPVFDEDKRLSKVTFNMAAYANIVFKQKLEIYLDTFEEILYEGTYTNMNPFQISLNFPKNYAEETAMYIFCMPNLCKPRWIDPSNKDGRTLGFSFTDIELEYTKK
jgi:hypothetical protein